MPVASPPHTAGLDGRGGLGHARTGMAEAEKNPEEEIMIPPSTWWGILRRLGPGLILAGSIVGSGELIATTRTGAEAGFSFLWLIILGCVIKVFTQIELAKYAISSSETTLTALNKIPGKVIRMRLKDREITANWIVLCWFVMFSCGLAQLGGIVGGVGQAMAISVPLTQEGKAYNEAVGARVQLEALRAQVTLLEERGADRAGREKLRSEIGVLERKVSGIGEVAQGRDDKYWAVIIGLITIVMLARGGFSFIEIFCTFMVAAFTLVTIINLFALQSYDAWAVTMSELRKGLSFGFPTLTAEQLEAGVSDPLKTALQTFGIIGVGASELVGYPYWCLEKGYGKWIGPREENESWAERARGWMRVLKLDAWVSMLLYTFSTVAFYLLGAAILNRTQLLPGNTEMVRTLAVMYEPVFGRWAEIIFLCGAFAVLFSTFFVANAQKARLITDVADAFGFVRLTPETRRKGIRFFSIFFPALCVVIYLVYPRPVFWVLISGASQSLLLPMLGFAALFFRYKKTDRRLAGGRVWDVMLWLSFLCFAVIGVYLFGNIVKLW